jgi:hypothetical protein
VNRRPARRQPVARAEHGIAAALLDRRGIGGRGGVGQRHLPERGGGGGRHRRGLLLERGQAAILVGAGERDRIGDVGGRGRPGARMRRGDRLAPA